MAEDRVDFESGEECVGKGVDFGRRSEVVDFQGWWGKLKEKATSRLVVMLK